MYNLQLKGTIKDRLFKTQDFLGDQESGDSEKKSGKTAYVRLVYSCMHARVDPLSGLDVVQ